MNEFNQTKEDLKSALQRMAALRDENERLRAELLDESRSLRDRLIVAAAGGDWSSQSMYQIFYSDQPDDYFEERARLYLRFAECVLIERDRHDREQLKERTLDQMNE